MATTDVLTAQRVTSVTNVGAPISMASTGASISGLSSSSVDSSVKSIQHHHHHHHHSDSDSEGEEGDDEGYGDDEEEELELYHQHCEEKRACAGTKKKLKKKHYRKHEAVYLAHQIEKGCTIDQHDLKAVVRESMLRACRKKYDLLSGDYEYNHAVTLAALVDGGKITLKVSESGQFESHEVYDHSANEVHVKFKRVAKFSLSAAGDYHLQAHLPEGLIGSGGDGHLPCVGRYDLVGAGAPTRNDAGAFVYRVKLFSPHKFKSIVEMRLPSAELQIKLKAKKRTAGFYSVKEVKLVVHLRPESPAFLDPRIILPCSGNPLLSHSHHLNYYESEEQHVAAEAVQNPSSNLSELLDAVIRGRLGVAHSDHQHRLVAHLGRKQIACLGKGEAHYRLGECSELFTSVALIEHLKDVLLKSGRFGTEINFHDPAVTEYVLETNGAHNILAGLRRAYKHVGKGCLPSLSHLLTHQSGLPEHLPIHAEVVEKVLLSVDGPHKHLEDLALLSSDRLEDVERVLGKHLGEYGVPLHAPGARYHHSKLGYAILRFCFKDWQVSSGGLSAVGHCFRALGCSTAVHGEIDSARLAPPCPTHREPFQRGQQEAPLFHTSCGFSAKIDELAHFVSGHNPWKLVKGQNRHLGPYGFLPHTLVQKCCINRQVGFYAGYGWHHLGLRTKSHHAGKEELRVLVKLGHTPGHHTVLAVMVPAYSLSFAFGCNADLGAFLDEHGSILDFVSQIVGTCLDAARGLENVSTCPVQVYNANLNAQLSIAPADGPQYHTYRRHCAQVLGRMIQSPQQDPEMKQHFCSGEFVCLSEDHSPSESLEPRHLNKLTVSFQTSEVPSHRGGGHMSGYVISERRNPFGEENRFMVAWDPAAHHTNTRAAEAFAGVSEGYAYDTQKCGVHRRIEPHDMMLSEHVHFKLAKFQLSSENITGKSGVLESHEPIICFSGRLYVRPTLYEMIKRRICPNLQDRVHSSLAEDARVAASLPPHLELPEDSIAPQEYAFITTPANDAIGAGKKNIASMLKKTTAAATATPSAPAPVKHIAPHAGGGGGGWGHGGGGGWGGRGWGGAGWGAAGLGLGLGLGYAAGAYPWYGPYYGVGPYYPPGVYGPRRYWW